MAGHALSQNLSQSQTLAPQMRQSLEILQANTLELSQLLRQQIEINPTLEDITERDSLEDLDFDEPNEDSFDDHHDSYDDDLRELAIMEGRALGSNPDSEERREFLYNSLVAPQTLASHLSEQIEESALEGDLRVACLALVGNLDERGFFAEPPEELAARLEISGDLLENALALLHTLDPPGIAARNLQDSLLLQLERLGLADSLEHRIVSKHLDALARKQYPQIARSLKTSIEQVARAADHIAALDPSPGASFDATRNPIISADVRIMRSEDGEWVAQSTNENLPRLRIADSYKDMLSSTPDKKVRSYLRDQIRDGRVLIRALDQRQDTILAITTEIIRNQPEFLAKGRRHLRPLTMNDVAETIGVHPTTVSRAVAGKYVETPHGIIEMRKFFATGYQTSGGGNVSNTGVREAIQAIVNEENPQKPLSDSAIEKALKAQGIKVARRTVAKYREQLNILPSHLRKSYK
ncbi:RNA polymerase factor sigma-54 [Roseibacillus ishigakijimensis]|uniref:RNA polymerase factor sigma-54 n=1 Tax=Roseibacillus ishigakijimensis TaxID=454146 RepID=A0A934VMX1_9BACT|nr:RNA polymerase factor sigma-54 [Roseibacillus ishigakijimensis]MBK1834410.1 RNA polymerase factor sigma-54 [Roseibacillus ishigakijimensis]